VARFSIDEKHASFILDHVAICPGMFACFAYLTLLSCVGCALSIAMHRPSMRSAANLHPPYIRLQSYCAAKRF
jgi:hypothetical protein